MNGLLTIFNKYDSPTTGLKEFIDKGLDSLSHRGDKSCTSFLMNKNMQNADAAADVSCLALCACSSNSNNSHFISNNGDILFFEGRLINKDELGKELSITDNASDIEIVMQLIKRDGMNCLSSLHGFWTLIYLDKNNKTIYGARDHFGNRPMYFCNTGRQFAISSESRTLYTLFNDLHNIDKNTVTDYLLWGNIGQSDQFFFKDIHLLEPSHFIKFEITTNKLCIERYYTMPYNRNTTPYNINSEKQYTDKLNSLITDSVRRNIQLYDTSLAFGVSGGMDSSALICSTKMIAPDRTLVAYTATDNYDGGEAYWAEKVVRHTNAEWVKVVCTAEQIVEKLNEINRIHNIPLFNASSVAQYRLMEEINKQGQIVFMDGQGGDEMLGGYPAYFPLFLQSLRKNREWGKWWNEFSKVGNSGMMMKEIIIRRLKLLAKEHYYTPLKLAKKSRKYEFESLMPQTRDDYFGRVASESDFKNEYFKPITGNKKKVLNDELFESYTKFLSNILRWGEHSAASHGIECVMPLSDNPTLSEFAFSIPSSYKIHNGWNKYLLRKSMVGIVPDEICWRKQKMGFYIPEQNWLTEMEKAMYDTIQKTEDPENCINKKYILENRSRLFTPANFLYQRYIFRCYSYLLWRSGLPG